MWEKGGSIRIVQKAGWAPGPVSTGAENFNPTTIPSLEGPDRSESLYPLRYREPAFNLALRASKHEHSAAVLLSIIAL